MLRKDPTSLHSRGRAVDIRAKDWAEKDTLIIQAFINLIFRTPTLKQTCLIHQTDIKNHDTLHFHLQDLVT